MECTIGGCRTQENGCSTGEARTVTKQCPAARNHQRFFGGLAALGITTISPRPSEFEAAFARARAQWKPASSGELARFMVGRYGYKSILYRARWPSSFFRHYRSFIDPFPNGSPVEDFLTKWAGNAALDEWRELGQLYLRHAGQQDRRTAGAKNHSTDHHEIPSRAVKVSPVKRNGIRVPGGLIRRPCAPTPPTTL